MSVRTSLLTTAAFAALALSASPGAVAAATPKPGAGVEAKLMKALLRSRELWATIDVCNPPDQRDYVGIRGSMPGDEHAKDKMYMAFHLQYMNTTTKKWVDLSSASSPDYVYVGPGSSVRQGGRSFQLVPHAGKTAVTLRGVVSYQWRRGKKVVQSVSRPTSAGRKSLAGADPSGYSAASCTIS